MGLAKRLVVRCALLMSTFAVFCGVALGVSVPSAWACGHNKEPYIFGYNNSPNYQTVSGGACSYVSAKAAQYGGFGYEGWYSPTQSNWHAGITNNLSTSGYTHLVDNIPDTDWFHIEQVNTGGGPISQYVYVAYS